MGVAQAQDKFKLKTLEAMAAGQDPYGEASRSVSAAEQEALAQQGGDAAGIGAPQRIAADIAAPITTGSDAVQNYLGTMGDAQAKWDRTFREASSGYAPPPVYSSAGGSGGGGSMGGLSADDLAINPQVFPESFGGGLRYGGFRTQAEGNAAVLGAAERARVAAQAQDEALGLAAYGAAQKAAEARAGFKPKMPTGPRRPVTSRGFRFAEEEANVARFAPSAGSRVPSHRGTRPEQRGEQREAADRRADAIRADITDAATPRRPVVSRGGRMAEEERNDRAWRGPEYQALTDARARDAEFVVPEDWELERQAALDWGYNPYIAEGLYQEPTAAERNAAIRAEAQLGQRLNDPDGLTLAERSAYDQALLEGAYGADVVAGANSVGVTPDDYLAIASDPTFVQAEADAAQVYAETGGNLDQVEMTLIDYGLSPAAIRMILDSYTGLGVNSSNVDTGYVLGG